MGGMWGVAGGQAGKGGGSSGAGERAAGGLPTRTCMQASMRPSATHSRGFPLPPHALRWS